MLTCFGKEVKPEFCTMGGIYVSEIFLVLFYQTVTNDLKFSISGQKNGFELEPFDEKSANYLH